MLEARWDSPATPTSILVFCHPHPLHGGTMTAPLMERVTAHLVESGIAVLRFNFRGVGRSEGSWGGGQAELEDVGAAMRAAGHAALRVGLGGWSFGAATGLRWQAATGDAAPYVGIAPPVSNVPEPGELANAPRTIIMGERDQLISFEECRDYAASIGARFVPVGTDHFFTLQEDVVARHAREALCGA